MTPCPKPARRGPSPRKRITRTTPVRKRSSKRASVEAKDREWASGVQTRAGWRCEGCRWISATLDSHHIRPKSTHPRLRHVVDNGAALCRDCHMEAHAHPRLFKAWLLSVRPEAARLWAAEEE